MSTEVSCGKCGWAWVPKIKGRLPACCPRCKRYDWNTRAEDGEDLLTEPAGAIKRSLSEEEGPVLPEEVPPSVTEPTPVKNRDKPISILGPPPVKENVLHRLIGDRESVSEGIDDEFDFGA